MSQYKDVEVGQTVYFWFAANALNGGAADGTSPLYDVRQAGAAADAAPVASGSPALLTHANYSDGLHEIAINTTGYAPGEYAVFCTLTISTVNPAGFCGSFRVVAVGDSLHSAAAALMDRILGTLAAGTHAPQSGDSYANVSAVKAKTDQMTFTVAGQIDANMQAINDAALKGDGSSVNKWGPA